MTEARWCGGEGGYALNKFKGNSDKWDPAGDPPDPVITATVRGIGKPVILKCTQNDTLIANCLTGNEIDVDLQTTIEVALTDNDAFSNDNIAKVGPFKFAAAANRPGQPLPTPATGAISRVLLQLDPVGSVATAMAKMQEFKTNMCKCTDAACATKVTEDMTKWSQEFAKTASKDQQIDEATTQKLTELTIAMSECAQKAMTPSGS